MKSFSFKQFSSVVCRPASESQSVIIGSLPKSDALRYRCHTILALQRVIAQLHVKAAPHMPAQSQLRLLAVLQVSLAVACLCKLAPAEMTCFPTCSSWASLDYCLVLLILLSLAIFGTHMVKMISMPVCCRTLCKMLPALTTTVLAEPQHRNASCTAVMRTLHPSSRRRLLLSSRKKWKRQERARATPTQTSYQRRLRLLLTIPAWTCHKLAARLRSSHRSTLTTR